tara:strand:- start:170 stop:331 length:162 start_codon:yes stop_codon:yes gene_type:complete
MVFMIAVRKFDEYANRPAVSKVKGGGIPAFNGSAALLISVRRFMLKATEFFLF